MAKVKPSAAPKKSTSRTEDVATSQKPKPKGEAAVKPKAHAAETAPVTASTKKADKTKKSKPEKHEPVVHAPTPKVQAEAHETQEKIRELIKLAKEQGYLTWDDLNEALPDGVNDPDLIESIQTRLRPWNSTSLRRRM